MRRPAGRIRRAARRAHRDAVHDLRKRRRRARLRFFLRRLVPPLPHEFSVAVEHRHATISVAVGHVDFAVGRIDHNPGGIEELSATHVLILRLARAVFAVEYAALSNLHQQLAVVAPLLDDAVAVAGQPDVALSIDETPMNNPGHRVRVAPGIDEIAREVEDQDGRRLLRGLGLLFRNVAPVGDDEVVMGIDADAAGAPDNPTLGQRFRPGGVDSELRAGGLGSRPDGRRASKAPHQQRDQRKTDRETGVLQRRHGRTLPP